MGIDVKLSFSEKKPVVEGQVLVGKSMGFRARLLGTTTDLNARDRVHLLHVVVGG